MTVWGLAALSVALRASNRYGEALGHAQCVVDLAFVPPHPEARLRHAHFFLSRLRPKRSLWSDDAGVPAWVG